MLRRRLVFLACGLYSALFCIAAAKERAAAPAKSVESENAVEDSSVEPDGDDAAEPAESNGKGATGRLPIKPGVSPDPAIDLLEPRTYRLKMIVRVDSPNDTESKNVVVVAPIPMDWPEQRARQIGSAKVTPGGKYVETVKRGQCATMKFTIPSIPAGESAGVELLYEITRWRMEFNHPTDELELPRGAAAEVRDQFARNDAPGLEMKNPKIVDLTHELEKQHADERPWELVKGFWQWTRDNVEFKNGDFRGALFAVEQKCGDCEEIERVVCQHVSLVGNLRP